MSAIGESRDRLCSLLLEVYREANRLEQLATATDGGVSMASLEDFTRICLVAAETHRVLPIALKSKLRTSDLVEPRWFAMVACREITGKPFAAIGAFFNRDHGSVVHALRHVKMRCEIDRKYAARFTDFMSKAKAALAQHQEQAS